MSYIYIYFFIYFYAQNIGFVKIFDGLETYLPHSIAPMENLSTFRTNALQKHSECNSFIIGGTACIWIFTASPIYFGLEQGPYVTH